jgi:hypothetical protein
MQSWVFLVEYVAELDLSIEIFFKWVESNKIKRLIGEVKCTNIVDFARVNLLPMKSKLCLAYCFYDENLDERTTIASESMFSAIKKGPVAAKPSMSIDKSAIQQVKGTELREAKQKAHNAAQVTSSSLWTRSPTLKHLTAHMEGIACMLFHLGSKSSISCETPTEWLVYASWCTAPEESPLPAFDQLFKVLLVGRKWMTCTC